MAQLIVMLKVVQSESNRRPIVSLISDSNKNNDARMKIMDIERVC